MGRKRNRKENEPLDDLRHQLPSPSPPNPPPPLSLPLTPTDIQSFQKNGYIHLQQAFPSTIASSCRSILWSKLSTEHSITPTDTSSWVERQGIPHLYSPKRDGYPWSQVFTTKLQSAINQLCGGGTPSSSSSRWNNHDGDFGLGWWIVNFPLSKFYQPPWGNAGKWHIDGSHFLHHINSKEIGLVLMMLFSDVKKDAGGTALSVGSHIHAARCLLENPKGLKGSMLSRKTLEKIEGNGGHEDIVQCTGHAGDVYLVHPLLVHARGKNLAREGDVDSVRFMCNPSVQLQENMRFSRKMLWKAKRRGWEELRGGVDFTPVEQSIVDACLKDDGKDHVPVAM